MRDSSAVLLEAICGRFMTAISALSTSSQNDVLHFKTGEGMQKRLLGKSNAAIYDAAILCPCSIEHVVNADAIAVLLEPIGVPDDVQQHLKLSVGEIRKEHVEELIGY
jgi:hypothetical protein